MASNKFKPGDRVRPLVPRNYIAAGVEMEIVGRTKSAEFFICDVPGKTSYLRTRYHSNELELVPPDPEPEPRFYPAQREENPRDMNPTNTPEMANHYEDDEARFEQVESVVIGNKAHKVYRDPVGQAFVVTGSRITYLTTLDRLGVPLVLIEPDPFDALPPGLYANAARTERLFRKNADGTWEIADPRSTYIPARFAGDLEAAARYTFELGNLKPVTIG